MALSCIIIVMLSVRAPMFEGLVVDEADSVEARVYCMNQFFFVVAALLLSSTTIT
jgi:hypothetical protein